MFPWLFPYGKGGRGQPRHKNEISDMTHKRLLLMYHDKHFQLDSHFPLIAFNHEQIKSSTTGGHLLAKKENFPDIAKHLMNIDINILSDLTKRMNGGEGVR